MVGSVIYEALNSSIENTLHGVITTTRRLKHWFRYVLTPLDGNSFLNCQFVLKLCTEYGSDTDVLCQISKQSSKSDRCYRPMRFREG